MLSLNGEERKWEEKKKEEEKDGVKRKNKISATLFVNYIICFGNGLDHKWEKKGGVVWIHE